MFQYTVVKPKPLIAHVTPWVMSISTVVVSGFHTQAHYGRRDSSAAQVGWSCSAQYQASQHQHSAELSCWMTAYTAPNKFINVGNGWGARCKALLDHHPSSPLPGEDEGKRELSQVEGIGIETVTSECRVLMDLQPIYWKSRTEHGTDIIQPHSHVPLLLLAQERKQPGEKHR